MQLAVDLSRLNVERGSGGPFGAAIFDGASGALLGIGMNSVVRLNNSTLHAEMMAFMRAQASVGSFSLATSAGAGRELFTSCEPCAMCLGGVLWSGVTRVVFAARRDDAQRLAFDEGPVFPESFAYLRRRGIRIEGGPLRDEARQVMEAYRARGGVIYNA
ncbi:MAG: nucleoside deaminase [Cytophagaceae bacterium]|nr:nucleoside deaminase [Gemmatimonadaceae bacterium]